MMAIKASKSNSSSERTPAASILFMASRAILTRYSRLNLLSLFDVVAKLF